MPHVFISYIHENLDAVVRLRDALEAYGIEVWFDRDRIPPGSRWADAIRDGISQGAFYIACFSEEYSKRSRTYMNEELIVAIEELRLHPFDRTWFIPVLLSPCEIPNRSIGAGETLRSFQWIDLSENWSEGIRRVLSVIQPVSARVDELIQALRNDSSETFIKAVEALGKIGVAAKNAAPALLDKLEEEEGPLHADIIRALQSMEVSNDDIVSRITLGCEKHPTRNWGRGGSATLVSMGEVAVPSILKEKDNPHKDQDLVGNLLRETLIQMGPIAVPHLIAALENANDNRKHFILKVIAEIGGPAKSALTAVLREMDSSNVIVKSAAIAALGAIGDPVAVPLLIPLMDDSSLFDHLTERGTPAEALGCIGDPNAVPALIKFMLDPDQASEYRGFCATSLGQIGDPVAVPALVEVLENENNDNYFRIDAANALSKMGGKAKTSVERLYRVLLVTSNIEVRYHTVLTILKIGGDPKRVVPALIQELRFGHSRRRDAVANVLRQIGPDAIDAVPELLNVLEEENSVHDAVIEALKAINPKSV